MIPSDLDSFAAAWRAAGAMKGEKFAPTPSSIALAFSALLQYDLADVTMALSAHVRDPDRGQFAPMPADIVRQIELGTESRAILAWDKVREAVRRVGQYQSVCFDDPLVHVVIEAMGGWVTMAEMDSDDVPFIAKDFQKRYQLFAARPPVEFPRVMLGVHAQGEVAFIGNVEAARKVFALGVDKRAITTASLADLMKALPQKPAALAIQQTPSRKEAA